MFEIESKSPDEITIITKKTTINFNVADASIDAGLAVGKITGPGEFEIGDATIRVSFFVLSLPIMRRSMPS